MFNYSGCCSCAFAHLHQFFSVLDGIYGAAMFRRLAASEHVDWVILDSNFMVRYGERGHMRCV